MMRRIGFGSFILCGAMFGAPAAHAVFIDTWSYDVSAVFDTTTVQFSSGTAGTTVTSTFLQWGTSTGSGQSSLEINPSHVVGSVDTNDLGGAPAETFIHTNNPVSGTSLQQVVVDATISLTPLVPAEPGGPIGGATALTVHFSETTNAEPCAVQPFVTPCPDIFTLSGNLNFPFLFEGLPYFVSFVANGLHSLSSDACAAAGAGFPCDGFTTEENQATTAQFRLLITGQPVSIPEPGILALLGIALSGLAAFSRRRPISRS